MEEYGRHLIIDLTVYDNSKACLSNREFCGKYLDLVTELCGMQAVIPTISMQFPFNNEVCGLVDKLEKEGIKSNVLSEYSGYVADKRNNDTGVSAFSIWNTSHCSLHSWTEKNYVSIDLYSCLDFKNEIVEDFTKSYFNAKEMKVINILRHHKLPQIIGNTSEFYGSNIEERLEL